ncbi:ATP-binding cassette domain-containing protein [Microbacterium sp. P04]|uniref:ATP-binding cassette domain-containing protein n=1 Tax=Microbacterium sp. P04 TaxID=3366947 RepID=UPI0037450260
MSARKEIRNSLALGFRISPAISWLIVALAPLTAASTLMLALAQRSVVDAVIEDQASALLVAAVVAAASFAVFGSLSRILQNLQVYLGRETGHELSRELFSLVASRENYETINDHEYMADVETIRRGTFWLGNLGWGIAVAAVNVVAIAGTVVLLAEIHPALLVVAVLVALPVVTSTLTQKRVRHAETDVAMLLRQERALHEIVTATAGHKETRLYGAAEELDGMATLLWQEAHRTRLRVRLGAAVWITLGWVVFAATLCFGTILIGQLIERGEANSGDFVMAVALAVGLRGQISTSLTEFNASSEGWTAALAMSRVRARTHAGGEADSSGQRPTTVASGVELRNVSFRYAGADGDVLRDVTLRIPAGAVVAVVGSNGAGKSTLVDLILGILIPQHGRVDVAGLPTHGLATTDGNPHSTGAFQDFLCPPVRVREAVGMGYLPFLERSDVIGASIRDAGATDFIEALPEGWNTLLGADSGPTLSHGQWQRLAIARAYVHPRPLVLALDEPTSALDPQAEHDLFEALARTSRQRAERTDTVTLLVSHRFSSAHVADLLVVLDNGRVAEFGTHGELMSQKGLYWSMVDKQRRAYL